MAPTDWATEERKLQPVFDDIQNGRLRAAQSATERWLKKHPKSQPALVARMMLADALGGGRAAVLAAYNDVMKTQPLSGRSIWRVAMVLRSIRRPDMVLALFQALADANPGVPDLADQVFFEAAAVWDTGVMAATSRKTFNAQKIPPRARLAAYAAWAGAVPAPSDADPFPLAEDKRALLPATLLLRTSGTDVGSADELWLRLQVALGASDEAEAWRLVREHGRCGALSRRWFGMEAARAIAARDTPAVPAAQVWADEYDATAALLRSDPEAQHNYAFYRHVIAAVAAGGSERGARADAAAKVFRGLVEDIGQSERAPLLGLLELDAQEAAAAEGSGMSLTEWEGSVRNYLARWGGKWSTVAEMAGVQGKHGDKMREVFAEVAERSHTDARGYAARAVAELYLQQHGRAPGAAGMDEARRLWALYESGLEYGKNTPSTDPQLADPVGLAAVDALARAWVAAPGDDTPLLHAAAALEAIVRASPSSYSARYTLVRVYRLLGAPAAAAPHLPKLGLTEITLDTLLHVLTARGGAEVRAGAVAAAGANAGDVGKDAAALADNWDDLTIRAADMYARAVTDLPNYVKQALQHESYSRIGGIRALVSALGRSVAQRTLEVEDVAAALVTGTGVPELTRETLTAALNDDAPWVDNRSNDRLVSGFNGGDATQPVVDERALRALGAVALRTAAFVAGDSAPDVPLSLEGLGEVDAAYVRALDGVVRAAEAATGAGAGDAALQATSVYTPLLDLARGGATTYARVHAATSLAQLAGVLRVVEARLGELGKGKGKGKDAKSLATTLKTARAELAPSLPDLQAALAAPLQWPSEPLADADDVRARVDAARTLLAHGVVALAK